jgi:hypothetical protein
MTCTPSPQVRSKQLAPLAEVCLSPAGQEAALPATPERPGAKRPGCESNHSPQYRAEVKNVWSYNSIISCVFMAWCLINHRVRLHSVVLC